MILTNNEHVECSLNVSNPLGFLKSRPFSSMGLIHSQSAANSTGNLHGNSVVNNKTTTAILPKQSSQSSTSSTKSRWKNLLTKNSFGKRRVNAVEESETGNTNGHLITPNPHIENVLSESVNNKELTRLEIFALKSLELTAPASDILLKGRSKQWVQCSGHEGSFSPAAPGTIWKKATSSNDIEASVYEALMSDVMCDSVPKFYGNIEFKGEKFIEIQDLLHTFHNPCIMDIKMGTRTFLESEVQNNKPRPDLYEKMMKIDADAPSSEEHQVKAITKLRYMQFRENMSSSSSLGFRIEGFKIKGKEQTKDMKSIRHKEDIKLTLGDFLPQDKMLRRQFLTSLTNLQMKFEKSKFFNDHEVIGSSLLFIYDEKHTGVWLIDFAKTVLVPPQIKIDHKSTWKFGNHEDGYLFGLNNLIELMKEIL